MAYRHLTIADRQVIGTLKKSGQTQAFIAKILQVSPATISREIRRNGTSTDYRCDEAHERSRTRRRCANTKRAKLLHRETNFIRQQLNLTLSPEQIASQFPEKFGFTISTKTIYRYIYSYQWAWSTCSQMKKRLRRRGKMKRQNWRRNSATSTSRPNIADRPEEVEHRTTFGHWEMDLFVSPIGCKTAALVLVERKSRYSVVKRIKNKTAAVVHQSIEEVLEPFIVKSITTDNGSEFLDHKDITERVGAPVFFCNPYHAWEKGSVENTIGLYREFFPKKTPLPDRQKPFSRSQNLINSRPRKVINFIRPISLLDNILIPS